MEIWIARWGTLPPHEACSALLHQFPAIGPEALVQVEAHLEGLTPERRQALLAAAGGWAEVAQTLIGEPGTQAPHPAGTDLVLDALLGLRIGAVERSSVDLAQGKERAAVEPSALGKASWSGSGVLSRSSLNTPYGELFQVLEKIALTPGQRLVDLGAGYGRLGFVIGHCLPEARFTGYEIVRTRVDESNRVAALAGLDPARVRFETRDLSEAGWEPEEADYYFLYDPVNRDTLAKVLADLRRIASRRTIRLIARGRTGGLQEILGMAQWLRREAWIPTAHSPIWIHRSG